MTPEEQRKIDNENLVIMVAQASKSMGVPCAFDRATVEWIDRSVKRIGDEIAAKPPETHVEQVNYAASLFYALYAECIIKTYEGEWVLTAGDEWAVFIPSKNLTVFPEKRIFEALYYDREESVLAFFDWLATSAIA